MATVNPPSALRTPVKFVTDPDTRSYFAQSEFILFQLWNRTGGQTDDIHEGGLALEVLTLRVDALELRMDAVELALQLLQDRVTYLEGSTVVTAVDVTAEGNQVIICTDAVTVTLALAPLDKDVVEVKRTNGLVTVAGKGNTIDGSSEITLTRDFIGYSMEYSSTADAWFIL